jgi:hypothetical protein
MPVFNYPAYNISIDSTEQLSPLLLELHCYRVGWPIGKGGLGKPGHFRKIAEMLWGPRNKAYHFVWHPWAEKMVNALHSHPITGEPFPHTALNGCGSCGKSDVLALYGLINWLADPIGTLVLETTTSLNAGERRIWGATRKMFDAVPDLPGKMVASRYRIDTVREGKKIAQCGIELLAGEQKEAREALKKLFGAKAKRLVLLLADELPELVMALLSTAFSNLSTNPRFQVVSAGNFKSRYDAFGIMCHPKDGWDSIDINSEEWETEIELPETDSRIPGYCLRFDGTKSPNILAGRDLYPIYRLKDLKNHQLLGEKSADFWRFCRSFEPPIGLENTLYSEADFATGQAYTKPEWMGPRIPVTAMDPSFTNGGDRCPQFFGWVGLDVNGKKILCFDECVLLRAEMDNRASNRDHQIARQFRDNAKKRNILPEHAAMDATAAGGVLHSIVCEEWSYKVMKVEFWGAPSELPVSIADPRKARDAYDRRVSELWGIGKEFLRGGQLRGLTPEITREMKAREHDTFKGVEGSKIKVETKGDMKKRLGFSPDLADCFFVMLELCRVRLGLFAGGNAPKAQQPRSTFMALAKRSDEVYTQLYSGDD